MSAWESLPPFVIIVLAIGGMGGLQGLVHKGFFGKPKAIMQDSWDRHMLTRDEQVEKENSR